MSAVPIANGVIKVAVVPLVERAIGTEVIVVAIILILVDIGIVDSDVVRVPVGNAY